jgi:SAM-dependent methyltransferase
MYPSAYHFKDFYNTLGGRIVRKILRERIAEFWPADEKGLRVLGVGYAIPYLQPYMENAERVIAVMPAAQGAHHWPVDGGNLVCLSDDAELPLETNSVDRIVMVHSLEFSGFYKPLFEELWRVLKSNGRILIIVPNRMGLWCRADWSPFGQGTPFSATQVENFLRDNLFSHERTQKALFVPPFRRQIFLRAAHYVERFGRKFCPALAGVHIVEATKQLYAGTGKLAPSTARKSQRAAPAIVQPVGRLKHQ